MEAPVAQSLRIRGPEVPYSVMLQVCSWGDRGLGAGEAARGGLKYLNVEFQ